MTPYYQDDHVTIYHGDCRDIIPALTYDVVITDPPYGIDWSISDYNSSSAHNGIANDHDTTCRDEVLAMCPVNAVVFGSPQVAPPAHTSQTLVWAKPDEAGMFGSINGWRRDWEAIYLVGKWPSGKAERSSVIKTTDGLVTYTRDILGGYASGRHPHGKPVGLMTQLIGTTTGVILDPFMGSGSTLRAAKDLGRKAIGIEIQEAYCELAVKRMAQEVLF